MVEFRMNGQSCSATKWHSRKGRSEKRMQRTKQRWDPHSRSRLESRSVAPMRKRCIKVYNSYKETGKEEEKQLCIVALLSIVIVELTLFGT